MSESLQFDGDISIIVDRMKDFCFYFIRHLEGKLGYYLLILEEDSKGADKSSLGGTILAGGAALVPSIGRRLGTAITKGDKLLANRSDKADAVRLSELVYHHAKHHDESRKAYLEVAYELFACYESQFAQVTCKGGVTRALEKLAYDAADRLMSSLLHSEIESICTENTPKKTMIEAIVENQGNFFQELGLMKIGRTVKTKSKSSSKEKNWRSSDIYTKVGVYTPNPPSFYSNEQCNVDMYGFRHCFTYENDESLEKLYTKLNSPDDDYSLIMPTFTFSPYNFAKYYVDIDKYYLERTSPIQADLHEHHEETLGLIEKVENRAQQDRDVKHAEVMTGKQELEDAIKADHGEQKQREEAFMAKLDMVCQKQAECAEKVNEIKEHGEPIVINKESLNKALKSIDPTRTAEFKKLKQKIRKLRF